MHVIRIYTVAFLCWMRLMVHYPCSKLSYLVRSFVYSREHRLLKLHFIPQILIELRRMDEVGLLKRSLPLEQRSLVIEVHLCINVYYFSIVFLILVCVEVLWAIKKILILIGWNVHLVMLWTT